MSQSTEAVICKRTEQRSDVAGLDGNRYHYAGQTKASEGKGGDNARFIEMSAYERYASKCRDDWLREHQAGPYNPRWFGSVKEDAAGMQASACHKPGCSMPDARQEMKEEAHIDPLTHPERDRIYRALLGNLVLDPVHREYLRSEGWTDALIEEHRIRSFPEKDFVRFRYKNFQASANPYRKRLAENVMRDCGLASLRGVPGAFVDAGGSWTWHGPKGILFPVYDAKGSLYGLRIRMDYMDVARRLAYDGSRYFYEHEGQRWYFEPFKGFYRSEDGRRVFPKSSGYWVKKPDGTAYFSEQKGKYRPLTSFYADEKAAAEEGIIRNVYAQGCRMESGMSLYFHPGTDNAQVVYLTEGEKKGIFANARMRAPVVSFPGVDAWGDLFAAREGVQMIDCLKAYGAKIFVVSYDADLATNRMVLRAQERVVHALCEEGLGVAVAGWDASRGKGLDDLLRAGYLPGYDIV